MLLALFLQLYVKFYRSFINPQAGLVPFPFGCLLKISRDLYGPEASTVRFVSRNTSIPVPRIIASARGHGHCFMLMTRVKGFNLEHVWETLTNEERSMIVSQLRAFIAELRTLSPPPCVPEGAISSLYHQPVHDIRFASIKPCGPFPSEGSFNDFLIQEASSFVWRPEERAIIRSQLRHDHRIVFTHGDLTPRNILVQGGKVVAVIDWEDAGWFPEHWEVIKALLCPGICLETWERAIGDIVQGDYDKELALDRLITDRMEGAI
ncbi:kinase-like protein [Fistulina hepatica ATCC 64428]|uniref:Kinase-like protein n=1 Tax=Fistulina hepatica ATCC 64428 TaxID=1128425 RepID=A0A0D7A6R6_9AGAR|nr:kinase-like protein [Fistulina hepatica ATCC 64428]